MFNDQNWFHRVINTKGRQLQLKLLREIAATDVLHTYFFLIRFPAFSNWYFGNAISVLHKEKSQLKRAKSNHITIKVSRSAAYIYRVGISGSPAGVQQLYDRVRFCLLNRAGWSWSKEAGCVRTRRATGGRRHASAAVGMRRARSVTGPLRRAHPASGATWNVQVRRRSPSYQPDTIAPTQHPTQLHRTSKSHRSLFVVSATARRCFCLNTNYDVNVISGPGGLNSWLDTCCARNSFPWIY